MHMEVHMRNIARNAGGFSLVELMLGILLVGLIAGIGVPSMREMVRTSRLETAVSDFHVHMATARNTAIMYGRRISMAPRGGSWNDGWQVFEDPNRNARTDEGERILAHGDAPQGISIRSTGSTAAYVSFNALGQPSQLNGAFQAGTLLFCTSHGERRALVMSRSGRVRTERNPSQACP